MASIFFWGGGSAQVLFALPCEFWYGMLRTYGCTIHRYVEGIGIRRSFSGTCMYCTEVGVLFWLWCISRASVVYVAKPSIKGGDPLCCLLPENDNRVNYVLKSRAC